MDSFHHSVDLISKKCIGCTDCIKRCPTEAIRVRNSKAIIQKERCIDCGMCIRICRNHAKKAVTENLDALKDYKYTVALPAPSLYSQFKKNAGVNAVLTALKDIGFDDVFEVAYAAELVTEETKKYLKTSDAAKRRPVIASSCPVVIRLIRMRFPSLIKNIAPLSAPVDIAATMARRAAMEKGYKKDEIGVFFISPCPAKATAAMYPLGIGASDVDKVISIQDVYIPLRNAINRLERVEDLCQSVRSGIAWSVTGGESESLNIENAISVDGMDNVMDVLEQIEDGQIDDVDFIEAQACMGGCVGGPLTAINGYVAQNIMKRVQASTFAIPENKRRKVTVPEGTAGFYLTEEVGVADVLRLDDDRDTAIKKLEKIKEIYNILPHIDCGSCGAPNCNAFAEDVVLRNIHIEDCTFMMREKVKELAVMMVDLAAKMPQTLAVLDDGDARDD